MKTTVTVGPIAWIEHATATTVGGPPLIYLAHPVAARPGEVIARCTECGAETALHPHEGRAPSCSCEAFMASTSDPRDVVAFNLRRAMRWWSWFANTLTCAVFTMPWYVNVTANGEAVPAKITRGLRDDCAIVERCDAIMLCGPRISGGMAREAAAGAGANLPVFQVQGVRGEPPKASAVDVPWFEVEP